MNCQKFENIVSDLARSKMMEAEVRDGALSHSENCARCRQRLQSEETLTRALQALSMEMHLVQAPDEVELRLCEAFRERKELQAPPVRNHRSYWLAVSAAAAILLAAFGTLAVKWHAQQSTPKTLEAVAVVSPGPVSPKILTDKSDETPVLNVKKSRLQPRRHSKVRLPQSREANAAVAMNTQKEITTDFMSLGYWNPASLSDGGQIVRVEMPRSTLANFGLPINMERYNEKVKADVLLGVDGLAHAIRFVQ